MEIWKSGVRMPFIVEHPDSESTTIVVTRYNWVDKHFEGTYLSEHELELNPNWVEWNLVREA